MGQGRSSLRWGEFFQNVDGDFGAWSTPIFSILPESCAREAQGLPVKAWKYGYVLRTASAPSRRFPVGSVCWSARRSGPCTSVSTWDGGHASAPSAGEGCGKGVEAHRKCELRTFGYNNLTALDRPPPGPPAFAPSLFAPGFFRHTLPLDLWI